MKKYIFFLLSVFVSCLFSQNSNLFFHGERQPLKIGDKAPDFIVNTDQNAIRSFIMPYMKDIVIMSFWNTDSYLSRYYNKQMINMEKKYKHILIVEK